MVVYRNLWGADTTDPEVSITIPTSNSTYDNGSDNDINIGGTASDNVAVDRVQWSNAATGGGGTATGTTSWSATIALSPGENLITVTVYDTSNNYSTDQITVTYTFTTEPTITSVTPGHGIVNGEYVSISGTNYFTPTVYLADSSTIAESTTTVEQFIDTAGNTSILIVSDTTGLDCGTVYLIVVNGGGDEVGHLVDLCADQPSWGGNRINWGGITPVWK